MSLTCRNLITLAVALCIAGLTNAPLMAATAGESGDPALLEGGDHHMHVRSAKSAEAWAALCEAMPAACEGFPTSPEPNTASQLVRLLDEAGLQKAAVLSIAYFFGFPELGESGFDDPDLVRAENRYVADQVASQPNRLIGFYSVNPLADYALEEVKYWAPRKELKGLKLHFANSNVDLQNPDHIARLAALFTELDRHGGAAVIHLRNRNPEYGHADAEAFIDGVLAKAPNVKVHVAHMGGWGGYDTATDEAVGAFVNAFEDGRLERERVFFGLAAVAMRGAPQLQLDLLEKRIRQLGPEQILFGTDWDALESPAQTMQSLRALGILDSATWALIFENVAPWMR